MKINFVYHTPQHLGSAYMGSEGLKKAFEATGLLHYSYNCNYGYYNECGATLDDTLDRDKLQEAPIFYVRGFLPGRLPLVARGGNQFKACWQSESYYTRHGELDVSTDFMVENQHHFNMVFVCSESDLDKYKIPTCLLPSWVDTTMFMDMKTPYLTELGFYGGIKGREDWLNQDKKNIILHTSTKLRNNDIETQTRDLTDLICSFKMLVSLPGRCFNGMPGRAFEIMGCRRLCFQWLNEDTMFEHMKYFRDGVDIIYFKTYDELYDKYMYYSKHEDTMWEIATNGYDKVKRFHNQRVRAMYIVGCMQQEYKKWQEDQAKIPEAINELYATL